ncbi:hypothetical protein H5410_003889, partial [Solanum commersonii]
MNVRLPERNRSSRHSTHHLILPLRQKYRPSFRSTLQKPILLLSSLPLISITQHPRITLVPIQLCYLTTLFEGDLPKSKSSESNVLAASEGLVIKSPAHMREGVINKEGGSFVDGILGDSKPVFDQTHEVGLYPSTYSSETGQRQCSSSMGNSKENGPCHHEGKRKGHRRNSKKRPFTRAISQKLTGDAMKSSETTTMENRKRKRSGDVEIELPTNDVVDVSNELSEKNKILTWPGTKHSKDDKEVSKQTIVDNMHLQEVLGGRVFDTKILAEA